MNCAQHIDALHDMVDGTVGPIRRAELQIHLDGCEDCRALLEDLRRIRELAGSLDHPAPPARVWLQLAGRLRLEGLQRSGTQPSVIAPVPATMRRRHLFAAIAAALVVAVGTSIALLFPLLRESGDPVTAATGPRQAGNAPAADPVQDGIEAEFRLAEQHYQAAIAKLEDAAKSDADSIDAQTAALIQRSMDVIDQAIAESRTAVRSEPASVPARDSLFGALKRKVALLQDTIALMNEMRKGNAAGVAQLVDRADKS